MNQQQQGDALIFYGLCSPKKFIDFNTFHYNKFVPPSSQTHIMDSMQFYSPDQNEEEKDIFQIPNYPSPSPSSQYMSSNSQIIEGNSPTNGLNMEHSPVQGGKGGRKNRKTSQQAKNMNRGHWSTQQNKKYHWFLQIHYQHFVNRHMRRMDKIFKTMELFVGTRQAEQCRSHHQKMQKKYFNFITIISNLRQQHYNSLDIQPILEDMEQNLVSAGEGLATIQELRLEESSAGSSELKQRKKSTMSKGEVVMVKQQRCQVQREQQKIQQLNLNANMLQESNMNIGQLILYHQRDDNSCLFNSIFKNDL